MGKRKKGPAYSVGVDVGSHSIKVAVLTSGSDRKSLVAYNVKNRERSADVKIVGKQIKQSLTEIDVPAGSIRVSFSGVDTVVRFITLPKMSLRELRGALSLEAEKYIPFDASDVFIDCSILGGSDDEGSMRVLLAAAKRSQIDPMLGSISTAGMTVDIVDVGIFAEFNALMNSSTERRSASFGVLNLGHLHTDFMISSAAAPAFVRQIKFGGADMDRAISRNMSVTIEEAWRYKVGMGEFDKRAVDDSVESVLESIVDEIQMSCGYFESENKCSNVLDTIYCSGGMSLRAGVVEYLSEKLGVNIKKWDPFSGVPVSESISVEDLSPLSPRLSVSMGLALRD